MANTAGSLSVPQSEPLLPVKNQSAAEPQSQDSTLEPGEARIRAGIVLQGILHDTLAGVRDKETAEAATGPIMRLSREMQEWARGFAALSSLTHLYSFPNSLIYSQYVLILPSFTISLIASFE
ncbi:MAG: hypothetical protein II349_05975, partial [Akkermansia sp.]|nr:hypothetical protein [Akkermansia sp.]